jgi:RNA polymerase sigma-70 factor (ECF subfamily)
MMDISDNELVKNYREGDKRSFEILVSRHLKSVYFYCLKMVGKDDANDTSQETFIKVWKNIKKFDTSKNFKVWMFRIARNTCLDQIRKKQPTVFSDLKKEDDEVMIEDLVEDNKLSAHEEVLIAERNKELAEVLGKLPLATQEVFILYYQEELNFQEISETLKLSINTVKSRHRRGLAELRKLFGL